MESYGRSYESFEGWPWSPASLNTLLLICSNDTEAIPFVSNPLRASALTVDGESSGSMILPAVIVTMNPAYPSSYSQPFFTAESMTRVVPPITNIHQRIRDLYGSDWTGSLSPQFIVYRL